MASLNYLPETRKIPQSNLSAIFSGVTNEKKAISRYERKVTECPPARVRVYEET